MVRLLGAVVVLLLLLLLSCLALLFFSYFLWRSVIALSKWVC